MVIPVQRAFFLGFVKVKEDKYTPDVHLSFFKVKSLIFTVLFSERIGERTLAVRLLTQFADQGN